APRANETTDTRRDACEKTESVSTQKCRVVTEREVQESERRGHAKACFSNAEEAREEEEEKKEEEKEEIEKERVKRGVNLKHHNPQHDLVVPFQKNCFVLKVMLNESWEDEDLIKDL
ncbi:hypothetical protein RFI_34753, partial [Reticulomyxa filosa]